MSPASVFVTVSAATLLGTGLVMPASANQCAEEPTRLTGTATEFAASGEALREFSLEVETLRIAPGRCRIATEATALDDGSVSTQVCITTGTTSDGAFVVGCDDGSSGVGVALGSTRTRELVRPDGGAIVSQSFQDDGGENRRTVTTRFDRAGDITGYRRQRLSVVDEG